MVPPTRSRLPVTRLSSCTAHWATVPQAVVETPIRPYAAAASAAANSRAIRRISSAGTPLACSARSGVNGGTFEATSSSRSTYDRGAASPSSNSTLSIASRT